MKTRSKNSAKGFTLIELLVSMAITTVIITILVSVTAMSLDVWNRSRSEIRAARQGKAMIDTMARDFESLVVRKDNAFEWLYAISKPTAEGPKGNQSPNAIDLIFFSAATDRYDGKIGVADVDLGGDVSTIGYQLVYKDPIDSSTTDDFKTFVLYRKLVDPKETFDDILGQATLDGKVDFISNGTDSVSAEENFICENVYQFTITFHLRITDSSTTPATIKTVRVPVGQGSNSTKKFSITGGGIISESAVTGATIPEIKSAQLSAVEISLTVLTDFGLQQLRKRTFENDTAKAEYIAQNSYQYSKLVQVPGS
ncbi:MAG: prepilin-type N-terminal cleavage/methylation domain-containing protein [Akkermansiaceae bacterium]|nr:prepilin-type N-terminal cleavage/methylation domain-containing protein [Akkermansiaceae bacterium]